MTTMDKGTNLTRQFDALQLKQQERLARRRQKKAAETMNNRVKEAKSVTFGVDDDLDLKVRQRLIL